MTAHATDSSLPDCPPATPPAPVAYGSALTFESLPSGDGCRPALRLHSDEDTLLRVIGGVLRLRQDGDERLLGPGDEAIVPAGTLHRLSGAGGGASIVTGRRPARPR